MNFGSVRHAIIALGLFFALTLFSGSLPAQTPTGSLHGLVTDPSGASVANATVLLTTPSGDSVQASTNKDGIYDFKALVPGIYSLKVVATGFTVFTKDKFEINAEKTLTVNALLSIEEQEQKIVVTDSSTQVDINPANNAGAIVIKGKDLEALSDDPDELQAELQALAGPSAGPNGGQIYIDGFTGGQLPPKASIREIRVNQNPFSAEYDRLGYGRIEIFTKPGTDQFHGQLYISGNTAAFNARNPFEHFAPGIQPPGYESTQYSASVGGPLSKKASFFFNIERRDINDLSVVSAKVLDPVTLAIVPFSASVANPRGRTNLSPRFDFQTSANNALTLRYQFERENESGNGIGVFSLPSQAFSSLNSEHQIQLSDTYTVNPKTINETRFRYVREKVAQTPLNTDPTLIVQGAFNGGGNGSGASVDTQNRFELQNNTYMSLGKHSPKFGGRLRVTHDYNSSDSNFNGNFTFGPRIDPTTKCAMTVPLPPNCPQISGLIAYQITQQYLAMPGNPQANLQLAISNGGGASSFTISTGTPTATVNYFDVGLFVQDDWRIRPNVTLSYGLRYESQNNIGDHADIAPRIGLAWGIGGSGKTPPKMVLRLGYGIFYDRFGYDLVLQQERLNGVLQQQLRIVNPNFYFAKNPPPALPPGTAGTIYQPNPNLRTPYTLQTGVSLERQLTKSANLTFTYLNARGNHQFYTDNINALECQSFPCPATTPRPTSNPNNIFQYQSGGIFKQNQLIVNSNVRLGAKLSLFGYYTLNYANGDTSGSGSFPSIPGHIAADYGRTGFDVRHRVFMSGSFSLPYDFRLSPFLIASSGSPFNITTGRDFFNDGIYNERTTLAGCSAQPGVVTSPYGCFNTAPQAGVAVIPINFAQSDSRFSLSLRLSKTFGFGKKKETPAAAAGGPPSGGTFGRGPGGGGRGGYGGGGGRDGGSPASNNRYGLTFGVSARNIFNKVNLANPVGDLSSPLFGQANALAGRPYSDSTSNRRLDLQLTFTF